MHFAARVDAVDVVVRMEGMSPPGPFLLGASPAVAVHHPPAFEQHHGDVDAPPTRGTDSLPQPFEVRGVELLQDRTSVCHPAPSPARFAPTAEGAALMDKILAPFPVGPRVPGGRVPGPEPDEVVPVAVEEIQVSIEVKRLGRIAAAHVDQAVPGVRADQQHLAAARIAEVTRVLRRNPQGAGGRLRRLLLLSKT